MASGYATPRITVRTSSIRSAATCWRTTRATEGTISPDSGNELNDQVDQLDADERHDDSAQAIDPDIAAQHRGSTRRPIAHPAQRQRNQRHDDQRIEDNRR